MTAELSQLAIGLAAIAIMGIASIKVRMLDATGFLAAMMVGGVVLSLGGWRWLTILLVFHVTSSLFTKFKFDWKRERGVAQAKGGARAWQNVVANGVVASLMATLETVTSQELLLFGFLGAVSASTADTLATEIGLLYRHEPRLITNLSREVPAGTSGGVSPLGEVAALTGAALIGVTAFVMGFGAGGPLRLLSITVISGLVGCTADSLLGATIQAGYKCPVCGRLVECREHCGEQAHIVKGVEALDNNVINFIATFLGAVVAISLTYLI